MYVGLMDPSSFSEFTALITSSPPEKAPVAFGLQIRHISDSGQAAIHAAFRIVCACFSLGTIPDAWKVSNTVMVSNSDAPFCGGLSKVRPIILLEVLHKILMKIIVSRLSKVFVTHKILRGASNSALSETSPDFAISAVSCLISLATSSKHREGCLLMEGKSKAFDSITDEVVQRALTRLRLPLPFINFYVNHVLSTRSSRLITSFGPCDPVPLARGLPKVGAECSIFWNIVYDPLLCALQSRTPGVRFSVDLPGIPNPSAHQSLVSSTSISFALQAVVNIDDLTLVATNLQELASAAKVIEDSTP
jgi:hypothetical protein